MPDADAAAREVARLARILAVSEHAQGEGIEAIAEASGDLPDDAVPRVPGALVERLDDNIARGGNIGRCADCKLARDIFLAAAGETLARAVQGAGAAPRDPFVMEAIVHADGSRPSFALRNGKVDKTDPFMGRWAGEVAAAEAAGSVALAKAVGRIQPLGGHAARFAGTGSLIDRDAMLVLTNFHVIDYARTRYGIGLEPIDGGFRVEGNLEIDFLGEADSVEENRFRIVEVRFPVGHGAVFGGLDAAICRIAPYASGGEEALPRAAAKLSAGAGYLTGAIRSLALVGFPAPPVFDHVDVEWRWVTDKLFGNRFGVKRLAPGLFTEKLGSHADDHAKNAIGHDATTFGGASGSLVSSWLDNDVPSFALHFGGTTKFANYALAFAQARLALEPLGVRF